MRKILNVFFLIICCNFSVCGQEISWEKVYSDTSKKVLVAAHRGDWRNYVENSLPGVISCIDRGIDIIEIDVQRTKDGHFILMHDPTLNRTTNGKGSVKNFTLQQATQFKLKDNAGHLTEYFVPSLDTILKISKGRIILNLDKSAGHFKELIPLIDSLGCAANIILKGSGSAAYFNDLYKNHNIGTCFMPIFNSNSTSLDEFFNAADVHVIELLLSNDSSFYSQIQGLSLFRQHGTRIWYNALFNSISGGHSESKNALHAWNWFIEHDAYIIQTDYPFHLMEYLIAKNLHPTPVGHQTMALNKLPNTKITVVSHEIKPNVLAPEDGTLIKTNVIAPGPKMIVDSSKIITVAPVKIPKTPVKPKVVKKFHTVKSGDTLSEIAEKYHLSLSVLLKLNPKIKKSSVLRSGMKIRVK